MKLCSLMGSAFFPVTKNARLLNLSMIDQLNFYQELNRLEDQA